MTTSKNPTKTYVVAASLYQGQDGSFAETKSEKLVCNVVKQTMRNMLVE